jgi:protein-S-isoprenylcysteine O-methyltransferase Ste14
MENPEISKLEDKIEELNVKVLKLPLLLIILSIVPFALAIIFRDSYFGIISGVLAIVIFSLAIVFLIYFTIKFFRLTLKIVKERKKEKAEDDDY